jgi:CubicO group peptidase (beta-lactamase class C family)
MKTKGAHHLVPAIVVAAVIVGVRLLPAGEAPTIPTPEERAAIEKCLLTMPPQVQVASALVRGDSVRFLGVERTPAGSRLVDNRLAVFQIGSMTKVFTATLFAQQVVKGTLRLDDTVQSRLPFKLKASGRDGAEMTLGELASHTSGIAHHQPPGLGFHAFFHGHSDEPWKDYDQARFEAYLKEDLALAHKPGTGYLYSNIGMSLLGKIVGLSTGKSYEVMLEEGIFRPLDMCGSSTQIAKVRDRVVLGLKANGKPFPNQDMAALTPAGGIFTCAEDLARFARAQFDPAEPAIALTQKPVFTIEEGYSVALGWHLVEWRQGWRWLNHNGGIGGYTSTLNVDPKNRLAVLVLCNVMNDDVPGEKVRVLGRELLKQLEAKQKATAGNDRSR